ncbi:MAG TPA: RluA family pseudouridine synthase [Bacteroidales bacterium]|nr:RluA family pseudouridine synthase [Bacteroidales bacterium]
MDRILYQDNHLIVVNKLPSEIVQGDKTGDPSLLDEVKEYLRISRHKPGDAYAGLVHRIDRPVSGCVLYATTSKALSRLTQMVKSREVDKTYWAVVRNLPPHPSGTLQHYLLKNEKLNKSFTVDADRPGAKQAVLEYSILKQGKTLHLLSVKLLTGRHHQIRAQLAAMGCPIAGDLKYGDTRSISKGAIALHARSLRFVHPVSKTALYIEAPPPQQMPWEALLRDSAGEEKTQIL